jgi:simple sugar transport system ATP-binding protein
VSIIATKLKKGFPGVIALDHVDLKIDKGTIHALVGANGAGKSTLIKILSGYYDSYEGNIDIDGKRVRITTPSIAMDLGIEVVHQEVDTVLMPGLSIAENLFIERIASGLAGTVIHWRTLYKQAREIAESVGLTTNIRKHVEDISLHEKQLVVIARALSRNAQYLILDEPTAALSLQEAGRLFEILRSLRTKGLGIIYISHRLGEVKDLADEVSVLRNGQKVAHFSGQMDMSEVVEAMAGQPVNEFFPVIEKRQFGEVLLETHQLQYKDVVNGVNLNVKEREILGITGLVGAGKTELVKLLFGAEKPDSGEIFLKGQKIRFKHPRMAVKHGIFLVPEERRTQGLHIEDTVKENIVLPFLQRFTFASWVLPQRENTYSARVVKKSGILAPSIHTPVENLSGGNQQKVVIGKWIGQAPAIMIFDEPTHGIDIKAKHDVFTMINEIAKNSCVIYVSSEIDEVAHLADRILVMRDGYIVKELTAQEANRQLILEIATGTRE